MRSQKEHPMAELKAQKTADALATLPTAKEVMEQIALKEAEKASAAVRELSAAEAEKKALIEKFSKPSGVSDEERLARAAAIIKRAANNGLTEVEVARFPNELCTDRGRAHKSARAGLGKNTYRLPEGTLRLLAKASQSSRIQGWISNRRLPRRAPWRYWDHVEVELSRFAAPLL